jgi:hypothetical protein
MHWKRSWKMLKLIPLPAYQRISGLMKGFRALRSGELSGPQSGRGSSLGINERGRELRRKLRKFDVHFPSPGDGEQNLHDW